MNFIKQFFYNRALYRAIARFHDHKHVTELDNQLDCPMCGGYKSMVFINTGKKFMCTTGNCYHYIGMATFIQSRDLVGRRKLRRYSIEQPEFWDIVKKYSLGI